MKLFIVSVLLVLASTGFGQSPRSEFYKSYKAGSTLHVWAKSGLNLRAKQDMTGTVIARVEFGDIVTVLADTNPVVSITYDNIKGEWVKVRWQDKEGYLFNGYLSRYETMVSSDPQGSLIAYLKNRFPVKSETTQPPDNRQYNVYQQIIFENGVKFLWEAPEGGSGVYTSFPVAVITFQEMYLLARGAYPEFFVPGVKCDYKEGDMSCENADPASLQLKKEDGKYLMNWGHAD